MSVDVRDLHWAAGFLEGEGCFHFSKARHLHVSVAQVNKEPLDRLRNIFRGGSLYLHKYKDHPKLNFQCKRGHDLTNENNLYWWSGKRYCIPCRRIKKTEFDEKQRQTIRSDGV